VAWILERLDHEASSGCTVRSAGTIVRGALDAAAALVRSVLVATGDRIQTIDVVRAAL